MKFTVLGYMFIATAVWFSCLGVGSVLALPSDPTEQLRPHLEEIISILADKEEAGGEKTRLDRIMTVAEKGFDFKEMSKRVLGKQWRSLSDGEKDEFVQLFTHLLKYAYITQMDKYSDQTVEFGKQRIKGKRAQVETVVVDGVREIPVSYIMILKGEEWKVYDIVVEGVSLVRNYMEQFREILRSGSYKGLTRLIEQKITEYENGGVTG